MATTTAETKSSCDAMRCDAFRCIHRNALPVQQTSHHLDAQPHPVVPPNVEEAHNTNRCEST
eukprot:jgi/Psemu1/316077/fgenesh1_kg.2748_\